MEAEPALRDTALALIERLRDRPVLAVSTGAGMSRESGIPTFRGEEGIWREYRAEDVATPQALYADPALAWEFHDHLRTVVAKADCNAGHIALARLEHLLAAHGITQILITQNIDRLHERAGSTGVIRLHGDIQRVVCTACDHVDDDFPIPAPVYPPMCACGALLRPDVVLFGEMLPETAIDAAFAAAASCGAMLVIGTSVQVQPAASLPWVARENEALLVEINPVETPLTPLVHYSLRSGAAQVLPQLLQQMSVLLSKNDP